MSTDTRTSPVDALLPVPQLILFGLQHVLVMAAVPITSVFLVAKALSLSAGLTVNLISATFLTLFVLPALYALFGRERRTTKPAPTAPTTASL